MDVKDLPTPAYVVDEDKLIKNLEVLSALQNATGCKILLAQKAFSCFHYYPLIKKYVCGATSSGLYEARLAAEEMGGENHVYSPAYTDAEFDEIAGLCTHIVFNSFAQLKKFHSRAAGKSLGMRVNPQCSTQKTSAYDPCAYGSRLGVVSSAFESEYLPLLQGLHFHTLCEQSAEDLKTTLTAFEKNFGKYLKGMKWLNVGGGHHITKEGYNIPLLEKLIDGLQQKYGVTVYLEPGEAFALNAGYLVAKVLEIVKNDIYIAILDCSAECHMPDVLEMPYRPPLFGSGVAGEKKYLYRLSSRTCLAGDVIGDYSFDAPLKEGDVLVFGDMAIYTMVKNNTFNGMPLPAIIGKKGEKYHIIKTFGYEDFKGRLS